MSAQDVDTLVELIDLVELTAVRPYESTARRRSTPGEPDQHLEVTLAQTGQEMEVRARMTVRTAEAELVAETSVVYTTRDELKLSRSLRGEFVEKIGIMAVYPFLREAIFAGAARIQVPAPVVGLLRAGEFGIEQTDGE